jgi:hypothetical protein
MTIAISIFEAIIVVFTVAFVAFIVWWTCDVYRTNVARRAAHARIKKIGLATENRMTPDEISIKFRNALRDNPAANEDIFMLLASLYILRRDLRLRCNFFAAELSALPTSILEQLVKPDQKHIKRTDVRGLLLPKVDALKIAERLEENIQDLRRDVPVQQLLAARSGARST